MPLPSAIPSRSSGERCGAYDLICTCDDCIIDFPEAVRCATTYPAPPGTVCASGSSSHASTLPGNPHGPCGATPAIVARARSHPHHASGYMRIGAELPLPQALAQNHTRHLGVHARTRLSELHRQSQQRKEIRTGPPHSPARVLPLTVLGWLPVHSLPRHTIERKPIEELLLPVLPCLVLSRRNGAR